MLAQLTRAWFGGRMNKSSTWEIEQQGNGNTSLQKSCYLDICVLNCKQVTHKKVVGWLWQPPRTSAAITIYWVPCAGGDSSPGRELSLFHVVYKETRLSDESGMSLSSSPVPSELLHLMITEFMFLTTLYGFMILSGGPGKPKEMLPGYWQVGEQSRQVCFHHTIGFEKRVPIFQCLKIT